MRTKLFGSAIVLLFLLASSPVTLAKDKSPVREAKTTELTAAESQLLINRLEEIEKMDLKSLPRSERKALKKEVREIESSLKSANGGIYLSTGAIIIILLIIIIL